MLAFHVFVNCTMFCHLLWCMLRECVHSVPADVCVNQDKSSNPGENVSHAGLQLHAVQWVHAQVEEVQVGDIGHNCADLATHVNRKF